MTLRKKVNFEFAEKALREVLEPEEDFSITPETRLSELGIEEPAYLLEIYNRLGIKFMRYTSGELLNENNKVLMLSIALEHSKEDKYNHFLELSEVTNAKHLINKLTVNDLIEISNYDAKWEEENYDKRWRQALV